MGIAPTTADLELYVGRKSTGFAVVPDAKYPGMFRVQSPDGRISDMVNLARAKDAVLSVQRLGGTEVAHWKRREHGRG